MNEILTVSQVNGYLKSILDEDVQLKSIYIRGEISNFVHHLKTGHFYFTLKDSKAAIRAVMFRSNASHLRFMPASGMNVIIFGSVQLFERDGICQIICADMQPDGLGALYMAFEQLKARLEREGLFAPEHKRPLPEFPMRIGVITAKTGAALQDIIHILSRRWPVAELTLYPALVQGEQAPDSITEALQAAAADDPDLIILGRGGGSLEDLWAFNDERVARAVYNCPVPVVSAVGHETDYTICDFAADLRAPTPSAAAELCSPEIQTVYRELEGYRALLKRQISERISSETLGLKEYSRRLHVSSPKLMLVRREEKLTVLKGKINSSMKSRLQGSEEKLNAEKKRIRTASPEKKIDGYTVQLKTTEKDLIRLTETLISDKEMKLNKSISTLEALSPMKVLLRGYTLTAKSGKTAKVSELSEGDRIVTTFHDGTAESTVVRVIRNQDERKE